jgi:acyl carrier protein
VTQADILTAIETFITDSLLLGKKVDLGAMPSFLDAGIIDSTGVLELVQFLEDTWDFHVEDHEMIPDNLDSLAKLAAFVDRKKTRGAA